jgi:RNA polymerase sigma-70 factor, ECF subfamily
MKFTTWLYRIIVNICYDKIKMKKRSLSIMFPATDDDSKIKFETGSNLEDSLANNEIVGLIKKYAALLPEKQRMVFALRDIEELSVNEVSQILKISPGSVKTNLLFARRAIANKIKKLENYGTHKDEM